jgi:hypothetical protein
VSLPARMKLKMMRWSTGAEIGFPSMSRFFMKRDIRSSEGILYDQKRHCSYMFRRFGDFLLAFFRILYRKFSGTSILSLGRGTCVEQFLFENNENGLPPFKRKNWKDSSRDFLLLIFTLYLGHYSPCYQYQYQHIISSTFFFNRENLDSKINITKINLNINPNNVILIL